MGMIGSETKSSSHIPDFQSRIIAPLICQLSAQHTENSQAQLVWCWVAKYCIDCINNQVAVVQALGNLYHIVLFGSRSIGSCSSAIATVLILLHDSASSDSSIDELSHQLLVLVCNKRPALYTYLCPFLMDLCTSHASSTSYASRKAGEERLSSLECSLDWRPRMTSECAQKSAFSWRPDKQLSPKITIW